MRKVSVLSALLTMFMLTPPQAPGSVFILTRTGVVEGESWEARDSGTIRTATADGTVSELAVGELLALIGGQGLSRAPLLPRVALNNGEIIAGPLAEDPPAGCLSPISSLWGRLDLPLGQVARCVLATPPAGQGGGKAPQVILRNGDTLATELDRLGPAKLTVNTEFGPAEMALSDVAEVVLSDHAPSFDARGSVQYLIELGDGQRFYCDEMSPVNGRLRLKRGSKTCDLEPGAVRLLLWPGAGVVRLSSLEFATAGASYFGQPVEPRRDHNAHDRPLQLGQRWFEHGLGTRPRSNIVFDLAGRWTCLTGVVGLDPLLGRSGHCLVSVAVDGNQRFRAALEGPDQQATFAIPLSGGSRLELSADFGPGGDLGDYVNWCDLILIGPRQPTERASQ